MNCMQEIVLMNRIYWQQELLLKIREFNDDLKCNLGDNFLQKLSSK
ncbi:hypothetical protein Aazo_2138 ['Nostoc azollae' 0708]|uniref:Uncharacterized protein n=1 Tax=Nostoc azollae (strain 0708) TaxID=551115 RepID=D7DWY5_NOSA0|nr:hypothetical protein Aazo_2138 ['Nostoc azollae' 0708]